LNCSRKIICLDTHSYHQKRIGTREISVARQKYCARKQPDSHGQKFRTCASPQCQRHYNFESDKIYKEMYGTKSFIPNKYFSTIPIRFSNLKFQRQTIHDHTTGEPSPHENFNSVLFMNVLSSIDIPLALVFQLENTRKSKILIPLVVSPAI